jgi:23S rRNA pseudouridine2604 synthase
MMVRMEPERLSKIMARRGLCSRREADDFIAKGWVYVDGRKVDQLGVRILPDQEITLDPAAHAASDELVTILLHKPVGYVSGQPEKGYEPAVVLIRPENRWAKDRSPRLFRPDHLRGLAPAGRLDIDSHGLLVLTQDGRVARRIIGQDSEVDKEYIVRVTGEIDEARLARLRHGLWLDNHPLLPAGIERTGVAELCFTLKEGKKRQIRRMCELVGLKVTGLRRIRIGRITLGNLPSGQWRYLDDGERF